MEKNVLNASDIGVSDTSDVVNDTARSLRAISYEPLRIKLIREKTGTSQDVFADLIHISPKTLKNWEQGQRVPCGPARALLKLVEKDPKHIIRLLKG